MKNLLSLTLMTLLMAAVSAPAQTTTRKGSQIPEFDDTARFIFYSVLEGLYEDGLSNEDVDQVLMKNPGQSYFHFIYACPVCNATIWALESYRTRPEQFYAMKTIGGTFGPGLSPEVHQRLHGDDPKQRLGAINLLVQTWMDRRIKSLNLTEPARVKLLAALEEKRQQGVKALESFRKLQHGPDFGVDKAAPAYADLEECAVCNAVVGKPMRLPQNK